MCLVLAAVSSLSLGQARGDALDFPALLVPEPGFTADYVVRETMSQTVAQRTGLFLFVPVEEMEVFSEVSAGVRYTVLERSVDATEAVLRVDVQALDPRTEAPIDGQAWSATYRLGPNGAEWLAGSVIPDDYTDLVDPNWLARWLLTPEDQRPSVAVAPGYRWQAKAAIPGLTDEFPAGDGEMTVVGTFVGWEQLAEGYGRAARIVEIFTGSGEVEEALDDELPGVMTYDVRGSVRLAVVPDAFPYEASMDVNARISIQVGGEAAVFGLSGGVATVTTWNRTVRRDDAAGAGWFVNPVAAEIPEATGLPSLRIGETVRGVLTEASDTFADGTAYDAHTFYGETGQTVVIRAGSAAFDAYLMLFGPDDELVAEGDDGWSTSDAFIIARLPASSLYTVVVNSYWEGELGEYELSLDVAPGADVLRAIEQVGRLRTPEAWTTDDLMEIEEMLWLLLDFVYAYPVD